MANVKRQILTAAKVKALADPGVYTDGDGLTLRVADTGAKSWVLRFTIDGKRNNIGLGGYPAIGLAEARELAEAKRRAIREGRNPVEERRAAREEAATVAAIPTFQEVAEMVIERRRPTWSSDRHAKQWAESLTLHVFPLLGAKQVDLVSTGDVLDVLEPLWHTKAETATRLKQRIKVVMDYAVAREWRVDNPANGALDAALTRRPRLKAHHPALPYGDVPAAVAAIRESNARPATRLGFEFLILTAGRVGEVVGASWNEIDLDARTWGIPAARMKARKAHLVPLSDRAMQILEEARERFGDDGLLFPSNRKQGALSNEAFRVLLGRLEIPAVPHGFRSSARDFLAECTSASWAIAESVLAHSGSVDRASLGYHRSDYLEQRRPIMQLWDDFLNGNDSNNLTP